jgi:rod shape-determining protein MreB
MNPTNRSWNSSQDDDKSRIEAGDKKPVLLIGFDWGTNTSFIQGVNAGATEPLFKRSVRTVVGYAKDGIVDDLLPGNAKMLFGDEAVKYRLHLSLQSPMVDGVVANLPVARDFARYLRSMIETPAGTEIRAVIGIPANADQTARENMRQVVNGLFDRLLLIPEPFLAALGHRDETKLNTPGYVDPVRNSLFIDIGAGTSDICLVQGYYPTAEDQVSLSFAGDKVDMLLNESIKKTYPDCDLPLLKVREIKEQHSYVGKPAQPVIVSVLVGGKVRKLDLTEEVGAACDSLLQRIFTAMSTLIARASYDSVNELLQNIILTGGGSRIRNIDVELQRLLTEEGFDKPVVRSVGENYKEYVSKGALKAARQARDDQWQKVII